MQRTQAENTGREYRHRIQEEDKGRGGYRHRIQGEDTGKVHMQSK